MNDVMNIYTSYELSKFVLIVILLILPASIYLYFRTGTKKIILLVCISQLVMLVLYGFIAYISDVYFTSETTGLNQIGIVSVLLINLLNLSKYSSDMITESRKKDPDPDVTNRAHFKYSLNLVITMLIIGIAIALFIPAPLGQIILGITISVIMTTILNHLLIRKLFQDKDEDRP